VQVIATILLISPDAIELVRHALVDRRVINLVRAMFISYMTAPRARGDGRIRSGRDRGVNSW